MSYLKLTFSVFILASSLSAAKDINCKKPIDREENLICKDSTLGLMNDQLNTLFEKLIPGISLAERIVLTQMKKYWTYPIDKGQNQEGKAKQPISDKEHASLLRKSLNEGIAELQKRIRVREVALENCPPGELPTNLGERYIENKDFPGTIFSCSLGPSKDSYAKEGEETDLCEDIKIYLIPDSSSKSKKPIPLVKTKRGCDKGTWGSDPEMTLEKNDIISIKSSGSGMSSSLYRSDKFIFTKENGWRLSKVESYNRNHGCPNINTTVNCNGEPWVTKVYDYDCEDFGASVGTATESLGIPEAGDEIANRWKDLNYAPKAVESLSLEKGGSLFFIKGKSTDIPNLSGWIAGNKTDLYISWEAPKIELSPKKWLASDHIELWLLDNSNESAVQWIIHLDDKKPFHVVGKGEAPLVERVRFPLIGGREEVRLRIKTPDSTFIRDNLVGTLSLSFGNGLKQLTLISTSTVEFNKIWSFGRLDPIKRYPFCDADVPELR
jgi:hypothetical protein